MFVCSENLPGGAQRVMTSLANEFSRRGINTYFITFDGVSDFYPLDPEVRVIRLNAGRRKSKLKRRLILPYSWSVRIVKMCAHMRKIRPDVVIPFLLIPAILALACCKILHAPIVGSERNDPSVLSKFRKLILRSVYSRMDGFVAQSDVMKAYAERHYGLKNTVTIPNPLSSSQIAPPASEKKNVILTVGKLMEQKNHALLIDAFTKIHTKYPDYQVHIYHGEDTLRQELETKIRQNGMEDKILLCGVEIDAIKKHNYAKLFVLPSDYEGYPNVLVEAMANGIASISTDFASGSARDIIQNGVNGILVPTKDVDALAKAMDNVLGDDNLRRRLETNGRDIFAKTEISVIADKWLDYLRTIVSQ